MRREQSYESLKQRIITKSAAIVGGCIISAVVVAPPLYRWIRDDDPNCTWGKQVTLLDHETADGGVAHDTIDGAVSANVEFVGNVNRGDVVDIVLERNHIEHPGSIAVGTTIEVPLVCGE